MFKCNKFLNLILKNNLQIGKTNFLLHNLFKYLYNCYIFKHQVFSKGLFSKTKAFNKSSNKLIVCFVGVFILIL